MRKDIYVTSPRLPDLKEFTQMLEKIWESRQLTNNGHFHREFEKKLAEYLGVSQCSLLCNGTLALMVGLKALGVSGEVITTPFTFVATTHALQWNNVKPVFCDIEPNTYNIDPAQIESLITDRTTAILPVHVFGNPCQVERIEKIADRHGLKVIYDAAHAFGVRVNGEPIVNFGDLSVLSFHATKVFNTVEGGAVIHKRRELKKKVDFFRNFGFANETTIIGTGINAKQNELLSAYGLLQLRTFEQEIAARKKVAARYRKNLMGSDDIHYHQDIPGVQHNYAYFPILVDSEGSGVNRDDMYHALRDNRIFPRRYFYPLISHIPAYRNLPSAMPGNLPVAEKVAEQVLCLPMYGDLSLSTVDEICGILLKTLKRERG
ncbi:MAG: DegT/DnrJ/EryC1/StrS family aminotransferase [Nitrospinales bacterium]